MSLQAKRQDYDYPHIEKREGVCGGKAVVAGTRIGVWLLVRWYRGGMDFDEMLEHYPQLDEAKLHAAFLYYCDHREEIDAQIQAARQPPLGAIVLDAAV